MIRNRGIERALFSFVVLALIVSFVYPALTPSRLRAETTESGQITTDTTWTKANSPYIVTRSVLVNQGVTLTIEPGVTVKFDSGKGLQIDGQLIAKGAEAESIVFTSNQPTPAPGDWVNILFADSSVDAVYDASGNYVSGSIIKYCTVEYGGAGSAPAVKVVKSSPFVDHCSVSDSADCGICVEGEYNVNNVTPASVTVANCNVNRNSGSGIAYRHSCGLIDSNTVSGNSSSNGNGGGIYVTMARGPVTIKGNTITGNAAARGGGIAIDMSPQSITISRNVIANNSGQEGAGIYGLSAAMDIDGNVITGNAASYRGGGLSAYSCEFFMSGNRIENNSATGDGGGAYLFTSVGSSSVVRNNTILGNSTSGGSGDGGGILVANQPTIDWNNIHSNSPYDMCSLDSGGIHTDSTNNWWGTTDEPTIQAHIWDWSDDASLGIVDYVPYLTGEVDITPPSTPIVTDDGASTFNNTQLHASWTASQDPDSGVSGYQYAIGTTAGGTDVLDWISAGTATEVTKTGLNLTWGTTYYFAVKAKNGSGMWSGVGASDGIVVADSTPPKTPVVTDDDNYTTSTSQLHATWTSSDPESGITEYQYAIGTSAGGNDIVDWTSAGTNTEVTRTGLSLATGTTYYFAVKTRNGAGAWSEVGRSDGITAQAYTPVAADFSAQPTECAEGEVVSFTSLCSGGTTPLTYAWDFDNDGNVDSTEQNPTHTYATMGTYTVSLKVTDAEENSDTETKTDFITVTKIPTQEDVTDRGGTVETEGGQIAAEFPAGAITGTATVTIKQIASPSDTSTPLGFKIGNTYFVIEVRDASGNAIATLSQPVTITVKYSDEDLDAAGGDPNDLVLAYYDEAEGEWMPLVTTISTADKTLSATTTHLSTWAILAKAHSQGLAAWIWIFIGAGAVAVGAGVILIGRRITRKAAVSK